MRAETQVRTPWYLATAKTTTTTGTSMLSLTEVLTRKTRSHKVLQLIACNSRPVLGTIIREPWLLALALPEALGTHRMVFTVQEKTRTQTWCECKLHQRNAKRFTSRALQDSAMPTNRSLAFRLKSKILSTRTERCMSDRLLRHNMRAGGLWVRLKMQ